MRLLKLLVTLFAITSGQSPITTPSRAIILTPSMTPSRSRVVVFPTPTVTATRTRAAALPTPTVTATRTRAAAFPTPTVTATRTRAGISLSPTTTGSRSRTISASGTSTTSRSAMGSLTATATRSRSGAGSVSSTPSPGSSRSATGTRSPTPATSPSNTFTPGSTPSNTGTSTWTPSYTSTTSATGTRSYTGTGTISPTMTLLNVAVAQQISNNNNSPSIAIAGIIASASVVGVLGIAFAIAYSRRTARSTLARPALYDDSTSEVKNNPIRSPQNFERQRSMSYPVESEPNTMTRINFTIPTINNLAQKNPFMAKTASMKFSPTMIRPDYPPPPPPMEDV